jgi:hypothetical protein
MNKEINNVKMELVLHRRYLENKTVAVKNPVRDDMPVENKTGAVKNPVRDDMPVENNTGAVKNPVRDDISVENKTIAIKNPVGMTCRSNPALCLNCWKSSDTDISSFKRLLSEPLISAIGMINMIISVLSASARHCEERSDEAIQNFLRRSLSEPLISVIDMINMTGLYSKSRRDDTLLTVCFSLRHGRHERHGSAIGKFLRDFAPFAVKTARLSPGRGFLDCFVAALLAMTTRRGLLHRYMPASDRGLFPDLSSLRGHSPKHSGKFRSAQFSCLCLNCDFCDWYD